MMKHMFRESINGCGFEDPETKDKCGKKKSHLIHLIKTPPQYKEGEVVGKYIVGPKGQFIKTKE